MFPQALYFLENVRKSGKKCLVHCHQGVSRSAAVVIAYLIWSRDLSFNAAFQLVKEIRSVCSPNTGFIARTLEWAKTLKVY